MKIDKKLFDCAGFGKKYLLSDGREAVFTRFVTDYSTHETFVVLYVDRSFSELWCNMIGSCFYFNANYQKVYYEPEELEVVKAI